MDIEKIKATLNKEQDVAYWFLRRYQNEATTIIRLPNLVTVRDGQVHSLPNPDPREVISAPTENIWLTVYSESEHDGKSCMGEAVGQVLTDGESELRRTIAPLVAGAKSQKNQPYSLPPGSSRYTMVELADPDLMSTSQPELLSRARKFNNAVIAAAGRNESVQVSNLELFIRRTQAHVATSTGVNLDYPRTSVDAEICLVSRPDNSHVGEYTARLHARRFQDLDPEAIAGLCADNARAIALAGSPSDFAGPVTLSAEATAEVFTDNPVLFHDNARFVFEKSARYERGKPVTGDAEIKGERLNLVADPLLPFGVRSEVCSAYDATPACRVTLVKDGNYEGLRGTRKYVEYLGLLDRGIGPAMPRCNMVVTPGKHTAEDLMDDPVVVIRAFSDWNVDDVSGEFACEIRLGELHKNGRTMPFKGGLLVGNFFPALADVNYSKETIRHGSYYGPQVVRFNNLKVAG